MIKIFTGAEIRKLDAYTIEHEPIASIDLMERAAQALALAIESRWGKERPLKVFAGPGNNGGDALAVARIMAGKGYAVSAYLFNTTGKLSDECHANKERLMETEGAEFTEITTQFAPPPLDARDIVVDGLFGSGLNKPLSGGFAAVVKYINASPATVVSIDVPSGLMCEDNTYNIKSHIIHAGLTLSIQLPKLAFLFADNEDYVGEWQLVDIRLHPQGMESLSTEYALTEESDIKPLLRKRKRFAHKGMFGHGLLIAGSYGMAGAAVLAAKACLRSGIGLLTVHTASRNNEILQTAVPEAMVEPDLYEYYFATPTDTDRCQAVAIGPGLGQDISTANALAEQLNLCASPVVLDADALNILSEHKDWMQCIPKHSILTPHPKELDRLTGTSRNAAERLQKARDLAIRLQCCIVLKGAYTAVINPEGHCAFNPTGNPGMATGGSGDVLAGILLALLAQGYTPEQTCRIGAYVHGMAGDIAARRKGETSMTASDIIECLPEAWNTLQS